MRYAQLKDKDLVKLIDNRWSSSATLWDELKKATEKNKKMYKGEPEWWSRARIPPTRPRPTSNRIFTNTEAVINSVIANPPKPNVIEARKTEESAKVARMIEGVLTVKYEQLNTKEVLRKGLRDLFLSRLIVLKPFWNAKTNDFDVRRVDPTKVRFAKDAKDEISSDFAIEEIDISLQKLIEKFPEKEEAILKQAGMTKDDAMIEDPQVCYQEAWVGYDLCIKFRGEILHKGKNPYWDWDGLLLNRDELSALEADEGRYSEKVRNVKNATLGDIGEVPEGMDPGMFVQDYRKINPEGYSYDSHLFNYFDCPRKPYIFASILGNEDRPIGMTSFIEQSTPLQEVVDRTIYQIYLNTEMVNGITKVDSQATNMSKADAQLLRYDAGGVLYGRGVVQGVAREFGQGLPQFVFTALETYMNEIDNIMAASSAFRGEREGQETKAGRLALLEQSYLRLNEIVQVIDYVSGELFAWEMQLMKVKYTERHLIKKVGADEAVEIMELSQDDIEEGVEVRVIPGKTLPEDRRFKYSRAQADVAAGFISPLKYLEDAGYDNPKETAREAFEFAQNPGSVLGIEQETPPIAGGQAPGQPPQAPSPQQPEQPQQQQPETPEEALSSLLGG